MKKDEFSKNLPLSAYTTSTSHLTICGTISTVWWYIMHPMNNPTSTTDTPPTPAQEGR